MDSSSGKSNKIAMAAYTYFVKLIRDEHRKKHPEEHFDFAEFSAKCAEKWKVKFITFFIYIFLIFNILVYETRRKKAL